MHRCFTVLFLALAWSSGPLPGADPSKRFVYLGDDDRLVYPSDEQGHRIPDFSYCGYRSGNVPIPVAPVRVVVDARPGDATERIQAAIEYVSRLRPDPDGLRGAVLLAAGRHEIQGRLEVRASGVVLRGQGWGTGGTLLVATGLDRRCLIRIEGRPDSMTDPSQAARVADGFVPVGARAIPLESTKGLQVGDRIRIEHPSTKEWIAALGMNRFPTDATGSWLDWKPGTRNLHWDRVILGIQGNTITVDAPFTHALDPRHARCRLVQASYPGRIHDVGVENLKLESAFDPNNPRDEEHSWDGIVLDHVENAWARQVAFAHFAGSAVWVGDHGRAITIEDCSSEAPVSELGAWRRRTYFTSGQLTLFRCCRADLGWHDFAVGHLAGGPNAFVDCQATRAHSFSGPLGSWANGVLYDNVKMDGGGLELTNRETEHHGVGWCAANCVLWQCRAPNIVCREPPTASNWAIGLWGQYTGNGHWRSLNQFVKPDSLWAAQRRDRLGSQAAGMPTPVIPSHAGNAPRIDDLTPPSKVAEVASSPRRMELKNGQFLIGGQPILGTRVGVAWWQGDVLPDVARGQGLGVTRFVPSRTGPGFTDDLEELTDSMRAKRQVVLEHHWGLWYDRRRDDHQMIRRADAEVWAPFQELPWARSGSGKAWDGLSKYDLSRFNPWYFSRLKQFAELCDRKGRVLVQQMYFQHNVLEAGAHWADFPWRPVNCLQETGFPEPPPYVGDKRIFMAEAFYDVTHPVRRQLHRDYIRHCLDVLGADSNVLFQTGEEFTGPLAFMQFWLDTILEWERETGKRVLVGLSCTRDVQDAILRDPRRGPRIDVIDMKYWWYTAQGGVYDPPGGENLAPRQQDRAWQGSKTRSDASVARQVREYRLQYPQKAVVCSLRGADPWVVACSGGSIVNLPETTDPKLLAALPRMAPLRGTPALADPGHDYLFDCLNGEPAGLDLLAKDIGFRAHWLSRRTGKMIRTQESLGEDFANAWKPPDGIPAVLWLTRK